MVRGLLVRGLLVGLAAGLVAFVIAQVVGEPAVAAAIAVEAGHHVHGAGEVELVSRSVQSTAGLLTALLGFGAAIGGLFGLGFAVAQGRLGAAGARTTAGLLALGGFTTIILVPFLKYPANPPAVGSPGTIGRRAGLYFAMVVLSLLAAVVAVLVARQAHRLGRWDRALVGIGVYVALVTGCMAVMPQVDEVAPTFPASTLWAFRLGSLLTQVGLWATLGLLFGALTDRATRARMQARHPLDTSRRTAVS